jgi:general secretion pathway protein D
VPAAQVGAPRAGQAAGAQPQMLDPNILRFENAPLFQVLKFYAELKGRTILRPQALTETQITIVSQTPLTIEEGIQALEHVFALNQITTIDIGEKFIEVIPSANALQSGAAFTTRETDELPESAQFVTHIRQLKFALPSEVLQVISQFSRTPNAGAVAIDSSMTLVIRDYAINVKRMMEVVDKIDVDIPLEVELELIPIKYAFVADVSAVLGSLTSGGAVTPTGTTSASRTTSRTGGTGGRLGVSTGIGGGAGGQPGQPGFNPQQQRTGGTGIGFTGQQQPGGAAGQVSAFQGRLQQIVQRAASGGDAPLLGDARIIPDERTNSLLVFGTKQEREMIKKIIEKLDVVQAQVLIEALIVEVNLNDSMGFGVSMADSRLKEGDVRGAVGSTPGSSSTIPLGFLDPRGITSLTNFAGGSAFNYFGKLGGSFDFVVSATAADSRVNILSRPRIQTSHAVPAEIFVGEQRPIPTSTIVNFNGLPQTQTSQQQIGIRLSVSPLINQEGLVVLDIQQTVQQLGDTIQIDQNFSVPAIIDRQAVSTVAVNDGDTIILGGFITSEKRENKSGVPYLKDIPGLGALFRSKRDEMIKKELIVFIRPTVLPTPELAAITAANEREKLIDVKRAQEEVMAAEEARRQQMLNPKKKSFFRRD